MRADANAVTGANDEPNVLRENYREWAKRANGLKKEWKNNQSFAALQTWLLTMSEHPRE